MRIGFTAKIFVGTDASPCFIVLDGLATVPTGQAIMNNGPDVVWVSMPFRFQLNAK